MRRLAIALVLGLGLAAGCTQDFNTFTIASGGATGAGGDAAFADGAAGSAGSDASTSGGSDGGKDVSVDAPSDAPSDAPADAPPDGPVCSLGTKLCNAACVLETNPAFGCASASCSPCSIAHATATCDSTGACAIASCDKGYADCNSDPSDGCETNTQVDTANCGGCGTACTEAHASATCSGGACGVGTCDVGYQDCNNDPSDGCEAKTDTDPTHCGSCSNDCAKNGPNWVCSSGSCQQSSCPTGTANCNGGTGCTTSLTTTQNCGFCGNDCGALIQHATPTCKSGGTCDYTTCDTGWADCDGNRANGCETSLSTSAQNCGACGRACSNSHTTSSPSCNAGLCTPTCASGFADCTSPTAPAKDDGCETPVTTDPMNCGACGRACATTNVQGAPTCTAGRCDSACTSGWGNCTQPLAPNTDNGCETNVGDDPLNCGSCGRGCSANNTQALGCTAGVCTPTCQPGYDNCSSPASDDGCETSTSFDINNCGACGRKCSTKNVLGASPTCSFGKCDSLCVAGYGNCTQPAAPNNDDGCETNTNSDTANCGSCGRACSNSNVATLSCAGGVCTSTCSGNYGNCTQPAAPNNDDGCESNLTTDAAHCGACNRPCSSAHTSGALVCSGSKCTPSCASGWTDCTDPAAPTADNGCESNLSSDPLTCGACNRACSTTNVQGLACSSGVCTSSCTLGHVNCSTPASSSADDGCEAASSDTNCGGCGNDCTAQGMICSGNTCACNSDSQCGGYGTCSSGVCVCHRVGSTVTCRPGEKCSGTSPNSCKCNGGAGCSSGQVCCQTGGCKDLTTDVNNCGACGRACAPGLSCSSGNCVCTDNASCNGGSAGTCSAGICSCGGTACAAGQRCLSNGSCG